VTEAAWGARPARLRWASASHPELKLGRSPGATPDPMLWTMQAEDQDGTVIATLLAFGAHPTLVSRRAALASPDWPGTAAEVLARQGGVGIVLQAIGGDSSASATPGGERWVRYGENVAQAALQSLAGQSAGLVHDEVLAQATTHLTWDPIDVLRFRLPGTITTTETTVRMAALGAVHLICLPGEVTGAAWSDLTTLNPGLGATFPITLCGDELSYVESPRLSSQAEGERLVLYPLAVPELSHGIERLLRMLQEQ
jgi:neutral ceramidase